MRWLESLAADAGTLHAYLQKIAVFPAATHDEERALAERIQRQGDDEALARLVEAHLGGVVRYARRYRELGVPLLDLIHDGNLALIDAARRFDPDTHGPFGGYSAWWVRQGIMHRLSDAAMAGWMGPGTAEMQFGRQVDALQAALEHSLATPDGDGGEWTDDDVRRVDLGNRIGRIDGHHEHGMDLDEMVEQADPDDEDEDEDGVRAALLADLEASLVDLEAQERRVLELRLGLLDGEPRSLGQVGRRLGISQARASRLAARGVHTLRRQRWIRSTLN